jgi:hypothetical protein
MHSVRALGDPWRTLESMCDRRLAEGGRLVLISLQPIAHGFESINNIIEKRGRYVYGSNDIDPILRRKRHRLSLLRRQRPYRRIIDPSDKAVPQY